jgi:hypothetical protein
MSFVMVGGKTIWQDVTFPRRYERLLNTSRGNVGPGKLTTFVKGKPFRPCRRIFIDELSVICYSSGILLPTLMNQLTMI